MKIYTKKGDKGYTSLIGGVKVSKNNIRIDAYGTVDELNSYIGLVRDVCDDKKMESQLNAIQNKLFTIGAILASHPEKSKMDVGKVNEPDITYLENAIDVMNKKLPELKAFILPGGHTHVSYCHLARCVCRRAERITVALSENEVVPVEVITYLNRLSDYLFVLARAIGKKRGVDEIIWKS